MRKAATSRWAAALALAIILPVTTGTSQSAPAPAQMPAQMPAAPKLSAEQRAAMERRLQVRINEVIRQRLVLTDDQFSNLSDLATRMEDDRRTLRNEELTTRFALRQELLAGDRVNETRVADMLDKLPKLERKRVDLLEQEQRELSKFLTASQRARYFALQDELRRSMQEMQRRRMGLDASSDSMPTRLGGPRRPLQRRLMPPSSR